MNLDLSFWNDYRRVKVDLDRLEASIMDVSTHTDASEGSEDASSNELRLSSHQVQIRDILHRARPIRMRIVRRIRKMRPKATTDYKRTSFRTIEKRWTRITCILQRVHRPVRLDTSSISSRYSPEAIRTLRSEVKDVVECSADIRNLLRVQQTEIDSIAQEVEEAKDRLKHSEGELHRAACYTNKKRSSTIVWNMALGAFCFAAVGAVGGGPVVASAIHAASQHCFAIAGAAVAVAAVSSRSATQCDTGGLCSSEAPAESDSEKDIPLEEKKPIDGCTLGTKDGPPDV